MKLTSRGISKRSSATFTESVLTFESKNLVEFTCLSTMATGEMDPTKTCVVVKNVISKEKAQHYYDKHIEWLK